MKKILIVPVFALLNFTGIALAQTPLNVVSKAPIENHKVDESLEITDLGWMDHNKMSKQVEKINELAQTKLGTPLRKDLSDLATLQRIIEKDLVDIKDFDTQQAMGVVLGNVMLADFPQSLEWKIYRDNLGRSRALCIKGTQECLFPVTMLSRRMEVGLKPDVKKVYDDALDMVAELLPQMPFGGGLLHHLH